MYHDNQFKLGNKRFDNLRKINNALPPSLRLGASSDIESRLAAQVEALTTQMLTWCSAAHAAENKLARIQNEVKQLLKGVE